MGQNHDGTEPPYRNMNQSDEDGAQQGEDDNRQEQEYDNWKTS